MAWCTNLRGMVIMVVLAAAGAVAPAYAQKITIVATVNDEVITSKDLAERRALLMTSSDMPMTEENERRITPRILQSLIEETLQLQEARRQSITVTEADIAKSMDDLGARQNLPPGGLKKDIAAKGLSVRSLEKQVQAQLAWNRVVQRKLRRNVTVTDDELVLAQQAAAAAPGMAEIRLMALLLPIRPDSKEETIKARMSEIVQGVKSGKSLAMLAQTYMDSEDVKFSPAVWVAEDNLPPEVLAALRNVTPGTVSEPVRTGNVIQFIELLERRVTKRPSSATEVIIKQLTLTLPPKPDKAMQVKITDTVELARKNPGSCEDATPPATPLPVEVSFARPTIGQLAPEQVNVLARLEVGDISEPLLSQDKLRLVMLCERLEPTTATGPANETLRQELFAEKMDLEAQKHLRNLRREASIDIREQN